MAYFPASDASSLTKSLQKAYTSTKKSSSTSTQSSRNIGLRDYFEKQGYKVQYDDKTGNIRIYDPKTGSSAMVTKGFYDIKGGSAQISSDLVKKVEQTIQAGTYKLPGYSTTTSASSSKASSSLATKNTSSSSITTTAQSSRNIALRDYFENTFGYAVEYDDDTGNIRVYNPATGSSAMITKDFYTTVGGKAMISPDLAKRIEETIKAGTYKLPTYSAQATAAPTIQQQATPSWIEDFQQQMYRYDSEIANIHSEFEKIMNEAQNNPPTAALIERAYNAFIEELNKMEANIMQTFREQMGGLDPATMAAIRSLRETVQRQRENLLEEMSRRGLLQSGIWLEMERRLAEGELTAQEQLLAQRISDLQTRMLQALTNFANMRLQAIQTYGLAGVEAAEREALQRQQQLERNFQAALDEAYRRRQLALQEFQVMAPYLYLTESQRQGLPLDWAQTIGEVPVGPGMGNVPVRSYVGNAAAVGYDEKTGEVLINGIRIKPSEVGGFIQNGRAYLPKDLVDRLLGRY